MLEKDVKEILNKIREEGYNCFVSEAQLRDVFAIYLKGEMNDFQIFPEFTPYKNPEGFVFGDKKISFDLVAKRENETVAFEFKYKTKGFITELFETQIELSNQNDFTNGRYDIWEDIYRLEQFIIGGQITKGFFIFITNYHSYYQEPKKNAMSYNFSIAEGPHQSGLKEWPNDGRHITCSNNYVLNIGNDYDFEYENYSTFRDEQFVLLIVEVKNPNHNNAA